MSLHRVPHKWLSKRLLVDYFRVQIPVHSHRYEHIFFATQINERLSEFGNILKLYAFFVLLL